MPTGPSPKGQLMNDREIFAAALEKPSVAERAAFLDGACLGDDALRKRLEDLFGEQANLGSFLESRPAVLASAAGLTIDQPPLERPGTSIGPYKLLQPIGEGGMGTVWMAEQTSPVRRTVALKVVKAGMDSQQVLARFGAERQALALMEHTNIAKVLDAGSTEQGRPYFVMELVRGVPITRFCDDKRLTPRERLELFIPVCQAVQHAHQKGIIHRDLKPSNVLVGLYDGEPVAKVIDFGVAKAVGQKLTEATLFTGFGAVIGTPDYMSPEQAQLDNVDIDTRSDVYSLGVLLYELLTGTTPLDRKRLGQAALLEVLRVIREDEPQRPSTRLLTTEELPSIAACRNIEPRRLTGIVRGELDWIVMKALEKDRRRRYETASGLAADVRRYINHEPVVAGPPSSWYRLRKFARRNRAALATATLVATAVLAVAVIAVIDDNRQRHFAIEQARATEKIIGLAADLRTEREGLKASLSESNRLLAIRNFDRGQAAFEKDEIGPGLLWMIESWRSAIAAGDPAWQHAARANLAAWQPYHPRLKAVLSHPAPVEAAAFSPDGKTIVTGSDDHTAQLWDAATGKPIGLHLQHGGEVISVAFGPDGKTILTGSQDGTARLWNAATGELIGSPIQLGDQVQAVAFSPDGKTFVTGRSDEIVQLWDVATLKPIGKTIQHQRLRSVVFSPDGKTILTGGQDGTARLWDAASGRPVGRPLTIEGAGGVRSVAFSPDGNTVLAGSAAGTARLWDTATRVALSQSLRVHRDRVRAVVFSPDGKTFATGSTDKTTQLWDAATYRKIGLPLQHQGPVVAVAFSPDGTSLLTVSSDSTVRLWDATVDQPAVLDFEHPVEVSFVRFGPDGKTLLTGGFDGAARLWDAANGLPINSRLPHRGELFTVAFSPDGQSILSGGRDGKARLWDVSTGRPRGSEIQHPNLDVAKFSSDGTSIMTAGSDRMVRLWNAATGTILGSPLPQPDAVDCGAFSPDGKTIITGYPMGAARLWDVASRAPLGAPFEHPGCVSAVAFSPDGKLLLTGCEDQTARLWNVATRTLVVPPLRHHQWVFDVSFSPDGRTLVTKSNDRMLRLWDAATGVPLGPALRNCCGVNAVASNPDGKTLLTRSVYSDGKLRIFSIFQELPDDVNYVATWVEVVTGLTLDKQQGSIQVLDNVAWLARRQRLKQLGGPPETAQAHRTAASADQVASRAVALASRAVELEPKSGTCWLELGLAHALAGDKQAALHACRQAVELGSISPNQLNNTAWLLATHKDPERREADSAVVLAKRAVDLKPGAGIFWNTLGAAHYRAGDLKAAVQALEQSMKLRAGGDALDWFFLAMASWQMGEKKQARTWCDRALDWTEKNSPDDDELLRIRAEATAVLGPSERPG
jgi:eukaryotic-like serine/threonine-protein kinase